MLYYYTRRCCLSSFVALENCAAVVNEEFCGLIGVARGQVREEGGAAGGGDDARGHVVHV